MITLVVGTNREDSNSMKIANCYEENLRLLNVDYQVLNLKDLPIEAINPEMYANRHESALSLCSKYIENVDKFIFVIPEYNGGFPGILKLFIDMAPPSFFHFKKAGIVGISSGRSGNIRGTDQFTTVLNYLKVNVHFNRPKLSMIEGHLGENGEVKTAEINKILAEHARQIVSF